MLPKFRFLTAGESHGQALVVVVEGVPAGLSISEGYIERDLVRRQRGYGRSARQRIEKDHAEILSGVRHGSTLGSPISFLIRNKVWEDWKEVMNVEPGGKANPVTRLRPGHADLAGSMKYLQSDVRNILERSSARETSARVGVGAVARRLLEEFGIELHSHVLSIGPHWAKETQTIDWLQVEESPVRCADPEAEARMIAAIEEAKAAGDTLGGVCEVIATGAPIGLGSHVQWDRKLSSRIAGAFMSINAVKAVEIGWGFANAGKRGSQVHDVVIPAAEAGGQLWRHATNRAGGIEGGMTNGEPIVVHFAVKPISTLAKPLPSVDLATGEVVQAHYERSDVCVVPSAGVIGEAMLAMVLADAMLEKFGGDHLEETRRNYRAYLKTLGLRSATSPPEATANKDEGWR